MASIEDLGNHWQEDGGLATADFPENDPVFGHSVFREPDSGMDANIPGPRFGTNFQRADGLGGIQGGFAFEKAPAPDVNVAIDWSGQFFPGDKCKPYASYGGENHPAKQGNLDRGIEALTVIRPVAGPGNGQEPYPGGGKAFEVR